ncbi:MAG TPA: LacI family DNA-binding transcriptional regulator [bacterium]|nr:LacI family DNA-binding transcriptional regulator [bacterium]
MKKVTIRDVAKYAGVSIATVSAVINGKNIVAPDTRAEVLKAIKKLNYQPKGTARNLKREKLKLIGFVIKEMDNPFFASVVMGAEEYANSKGYSLLVAHSEGDYLKEKGAVESFVSKDFSGCIISNVVEDPADIAHLFNLKMLNYPFVLMENIRGVQTNVVSIDNVKATKTAMQYLFDIGHSKILFFSGPPYSYHSFERQNGFREAFSECTFAFNEKDMVIPVGAHMEEGYRAGIKYFKNETRDATAIVCFNDLVAVGLIRALVELNIPVPEEISVIGHDDIDLARLWPVPLTTMSTPKRELGKKLAEILIKNIESPENHEFEKVKLEPKLVIRDSTAAV